MKPALLLLFLLTLGGALNAQTLADTSHVQQLPTVTVESVEPKNTIARLQPIVGTYIFDGKKSEVISVRSLDANLADKTGRLLFAKVPGVFVYDMDGSGNQVNISTRGLDPHRGWEFNIRKDGIITNSDMYGYPASHYSIPMESIERIELVRGTGSLQYGAQFGGMLNYISKQPDSTKKFSFENYTTIGSFNLLSSYNAVGGKVGKLKYYAYYVKRTRDGFRNDEHTDYDAQSVMLQYQVTKRWWVRAEWARSYYLYKSPGPLTDAMFREDPRQATRDRNFYSPTIHVPSLVSMWKPSEHTTVQWTSSAVIGARNIVQWDRPATVVDSIVSATRSYNPRQVDIDQFNSFTNELRVLHNYKLGKQRSHFLFGAQTMNNTLRRRQQGKGSVGNDYDLSITTPVWGRDVYLKTQNLALFAENNFRLSNKLSINAGVRYEVGDSKMYGDIVYYADDKLLVSLKRQFFLWGGSLSYKATKSIEFYGGIAQTYRPVLFKDIIPSDAFERVDPNIRDASGYNAEGGTRGSYKWLKWDITAFAMQYNRRPGVIVQTDTSGVFSTYRTNIGNSMTTGIEMFVQGSWRVGRALGVQLFTSTSYMEGKYTSGALRVGTKNVDIAGNRIESVPTWISRNGATLQYKRWSMSLVFSYTGETYADPLNTVAPSATGSVGVVPAYRVWDINGSWRINERVTFKANLNNIANAHYFTKRPLMYPGPGIWPSDGRNGAVTVVVNL